ncbi:MAG: flagellin, partial [Pseudomonadota bacterium]|nr:flagellin [Pseudomonadota bacterium]
AKWTMTLGEGANAVTISADLVSGQPGPAIAAINAVSTQTGITATFTDDGDGMVLTGVNGVTLSDIKVEPEQRGEVARVYPEEGVFIQMVSKDRTSSGIIDQITAAGEHVADMRAVVGAQAESVDRFQKLVAERTVILDEAVSNLSELDLAAAITKLQSLLLNREASQSSFVKITQTSLFDYIR